MPDRLYGLSIFPYLTVSLDNGLLFLHYLFLLFHLKLETFLLPHGHNLGQQCRPKIIYITIVISRDCDFRFKKIRYLLMILVLCKTYLNICPISWHEIFVDISTRFTNSRFATVHTTSAAYFSEESLASPTCLIKEPHIQLLSPCC